MALKVGTKSKCRHCDGAIYYGTDVTWRDGVDAFDYARTGKQWRHAATNYAKCHESTPEIPYPDSAEPNSVCNEYMQNDKGICGRKIPDESLMEIPPIYMCGVHAKGERESRAFREHAKANMEEMNDQELIRRWQYSEILRLVNELAAILGVDLHLQEYRGYGVIPSTVTVRILDLKNLVRGVINSAVDDNGEIDEDDSVFG